MAYTHPGGTRALPEIRLRCPRAGRRSAARLRWRWLRALGTPR